MNKRGLIKFIFIMIAFLISLVTLLSPERGFGSIFNPVFLLDLALALAIFMYSISKNITKHKFIYNVINLLLIVISFIFVAYFLLTTLGYILSAEYSTDIITVIGIIFPASLFLIFFFSIYDIFNKTNKTNDLLSIVISTIIILTHMRYYLEPNILNEIIYKENYIAENYVYFTTLYVLLLIHYKLNKQES